MAMVTAMVMAMVMVTVTVFDYHSQSGTWLSGTIEIVLPAISWTLAYTPNICL